MSWDLTDSDLDSIKPIQIQTLLSINKQPLRVIAKNTNLYIDQKWKIFVRSEL